MFSRHYRKVKAIFGATDVLLTSIAFVAAYQTRLHLHLEKNFSIDFPVAALLLVLSALCWVTIFCSAGGGVCLDFAGDCSVDPADIARSRDFSPRAVRAESFIGRT